MSVQIQIIRRPDPQKETLSKMRESRALEKHTARMHGDPGILEIQDAQNVDVILSQEYNLPGFVKFQNS
jgi:hypothetical protein